MSGPERDPRELARYGPHFLLVCAIVLLASTDALLYRHSTGDNASAAICSVLSGWFLYLAVACEKTIRRSVWYKERAATAEVIKRSE